MRELFRLLLCLLLGCVGILCYSGYAALLLARFLFVPHPHTGRPLLVPAE